MDGWNQSNTIYDPSLSTTCLISIKTSYKLYVQILTDGQNGWKSMSVSTFVWILNGFETVDFVSKFITNARKQKFISITIRHCVIFFEFLTGHFQIGPWDILQMFEISFDIKAFPSQKDVSQIPGRWKCTYSKRYANTCSMFIELAFMSHNRKSH